MYLLYVLDNDAGVGPSATVTIPFGNTTKEQG